MNDQPLVRKWLQILSDPTAKTQQDLPRYCTSDPRSLVSSSKIHNFSLGTGQSIYANSILPLVESAEQEVILVTCFWARSKTLDALRETLLRLSAKAQQSGHRIRTRIYFSSSSLTQKLFHPQNVKGRLWEPTTWGPELALPSVTELPGLDLKVKSVFLLPFSVMHPKFVIIDRRRVLLPSCNVSWEDWFEGCVELSGNIVDQFVRFWQEFWATEDDGETEVTILPVSPDKFITAPHSGPKTLSARGVQMEPIQALFLPSPHHRNPRFAFFPWQTCPPPPPTPLNVFLLEAINSAQNNIYVQTPNLTARPILTALLSAVRRGVDLKIVTSEKLMILEQLVTAGTTTARCMRKFVKLYKREPTTSTDTPSLLESHRRRGSLDVWYYHPFQASVKDGPATEPTQSHLKLTLIDGEWTVLGSGNLDRASLFTSQELGGAFRSKEFAEIVRREVDDTMAVRKKLVYSGIGGIMR